MRKSKKLLTTALFICLSLMSVNAQDLSFGINAGINDNTPRGNVMSHEARYGFNVGVFGELELPKLAPGLYTTAGLSFKAELSGASHPSGLQVQLRQAYEVTVRSRTLSGLRAGRKKWHW